MTKNFLLALSSALLITSIFLVAPLEKAFAANIGVNTFADELNVNGNCSLREAIQAANTDTAVDACLAGSGPDVISLPAGTYTLSIVGAGENANATGDLDITGTLTVSGAGATTTVIDGGTIDRVIELGVGANLQMNGMTIQNGSASGFGGGFSPRVQ